MCEVPVSRDQRGIELAADRCDQRVGPVQIGSAGRDLVHDASRRPNRPLVDWMNVDPSQVFANFVDVTVQNNPSPLEHFLRWLRLEDALPYHTLHGV